MVESQIADILTPRLRLIVMSVPFMEASLQGRATGALLADGVTLPAAWPKGAERGLQWRLEEVRARPESARWLLRAMVRGEDGVMVGYINFHGPPRSGKAELGYTVMEEHRRRGYAGEAATAMMHWAAREHGVAGFILSTSPDNHPSLGLAAKLGFHRTSTQIDEIDGEEWVFERGAVDATP